MGLAEDQHKIRRIVSGSWNPLLQMYSPLLEVRGCCELPGHMSTRTTQSTAV